MSLSLNDPINKYKLNLIFALCENSNKKTLESDAFRQLNISKEIPVLKDWLHDVFNHVESAYKDQDAHENGALTTSLSILAAEDSPVNQLVLRGYLKNTPHHLTLVSNGQQALEMAKSQAYDLLIFDLEMPVMNGPQALGHIKALGDHWEKIPSIILTAFVKEGDRDSRLGGVCDVYLGKPFKKEGLLDAIHEAMQKKGSLHTHSSISNALRFDMGVFEWNFGHMDKTQSRQFILAAIAQITVDIDSIVLSQAQTDPLEVERALHRLSGAAEPIGCLALNTATRFAKNNLSTQPSVENTALCKNVVAEGKLALDWLNLVLLKNF